MFTLTTILFVHWKCLFSFVILIGMHWKFWIILKLQFGNNRPWKRIKQYIFVLLDFYFSLTIIECFQIKKNVMLHLQLHSWMRSSWYSSKLVFFIISPLDASFCHVQQWTEENNDMRSYWGVLFLIWQTDSKYLRFCFNFSFTITLLHRNSLLNFFDVVIIC